VGLVEKTILENTDPFIALLHKYVPVKLFVHVDLFAPARRISYLRRFWSTYARRGVSCHAIFNDHHDFYNPDASADLASALENILSAKES